MMDAKEADVRLVLDEGDWDRYLRWHDRHESCRPRRCYERERRSRRGGNDPVHGIQKCHALICF
jgi:hypothetical protein